MNKDKFMRRTENKLPFKEVLGGVSFPKLEENILSQLIHGPVSNTKLKFKKPVGERVLSEMEKQGLIQLTNNGHALTTLGKWYLSTKKQND